MKGGPFGDKKNFEKKSHSAEKKIERGDSLVPSGFVGNLEKVNKPGTPQVGAISKAQKDSKTTFSTTGDNKRSQKTKNWEKKIRFFLNFFSKFLVSRITPKM